MIQRIEYLNRLEKWRESRDEIILVAFAPPEPAAVAEAPSAEVVQFLNSCGQIENCCHATEFA